MFQRISTRIAADSVFGSSPDLVAACPVCGREIPPARGTVDAFEGRRCCSAEHAVEYADQRAW